ncbi:MocR-like pyridoxine biosynthesis transcription factor PdxR [Candidatus Solirubrobacter pratensis]|uniref:MocR-like pyridoxine biosynthesis transcription factor PdxR n=1 Tax=Candidatus Solirubrobacter pratensis TaxID=1298857 RepID=UPI000410F229
MTRSWAISGVDVHLAVSGPGVRAGLEAALREAVRTGRLTPGTRLPSSRALAHDLGVARNTVADAYGQLVAEGWLIARQGSGTRVGSRAADARGEKTGAPEAASPAPRLDLRPGTPDLAAFPRAAWVAATRRALATAPYDALGYGDPRGRPELRGALAAYLARARGVDASADRIVIVSGFTQGLALLCDVLRARGARTLGLEAYTLPDHRDAAAAHGFGIAPLTIDDGGAVLQDADAAVLTPAHQFPLGPPLAPERRAAAAAWARDRLVIEDDYDGEFRYDRQPLGAMQALAPEHIVYAGTASKTLAPGLRLAWLVLPARLVDDVVGAKLRADRNSSALDQLVLAELIASGGYDRHVRRARLAYRRRRDRLVAALRRDAPRVRIAGVAAGLHALLELPPGEHEQEAVARAAAHGVAVMGLDTFRIGGPRHGPALVVGYATPPEHAFTSALARLTAAVS